LCLEPLRRRQDVQFPCIWRPREFHTSLQRVFGPALGGKDAMVSRLCAHALRNVASGSLVTESNIESLCLENARTKKGQSLSELLYDQEDSSNIFFVPWSRASAMVAEDRDEVTTDKRAANNDLRPEFSSPSVEYRSASDAQSLCCQLRQCRHVTDS
jgi:hypothetical protein